MDRDLNTAPETWEPARRVAERVLRPLERFLHVEAASGVLLLVSALAALVWANSRFAESYEHLWHTPIVVGIGSAVFEHSLHFWINDALMAIFFFVVGLEIRREIHEGELADLRRAALPIAAALGGMAVPALIYTALNPSGPTRVGWGVPMATDIAFAVGVLALLGRRVPPAVRVLLLALAIIDDIGAIIVIAIFYSAGFSFSGLLLSLAGILLVVLMQRLGVRRALLYVLPGAVVWAGMLLAGIHPTIAGVVLGLMTPVKTWFGQEGFVKVAGEALREVRGKSERPAASTESLLEPLARIREAQREAVAPVVRIQAALHPWVAFAIMPLFALANAGVNVSGVDVSAGDGRAVALGVFAGLVLGKPLGIVLISALTVKLGVCALPRGVGWSAITLVGCVAGIGFTMAIFIAGLAFPAPELLGSAKLGVLVASLTSALVGAVVGLFAMPGSYDRSAAQTLQEAESSTET